MVRLRDAAGLDPRGEEGRLFIDDLAFSGAAGKRKLDFDREIAQVLRESDRPAQPWMCLPVPVGLLQCRRGRPAGTGAGPAAPA